MKKRILVEPLPTQGHYNSMLKLAESLKDSYEFIFIGPNEFSNKVITLGFDFKIAQTYLFTPVQLRLKQEGIFNFILEQYFSSRPGFVNEIQRSAKKYEQVFHEIKPDMIFLDDHLAPKSFLYAKFRIPVIIILTMLPANKSSDVPPFQSMHIPAPTTVSKWIIKFEWKKIALSRALTLLFWNLITNGKTNRNIYQKYLNQSMTLQLDINGSFNPIIKGLHYITTIPRELEFPFVKHSNVFYFTIPSAKYIGPLMEDRIKVFINRASEMKKRHPGVRLIYVSLGTVTDEFKRTCRFVFQEIIKLAKVESNYHFILSLGSSLDVLHINEKPDNVVIFKNVPQKTLLYRVDAMINHGGANSVLECIQAQVPMLIYPLTSEWDQPGVAARVQYHGLGLSEPVRFATARRIKSNLLKLFSNYDSYKSSLLTKQLEIELQSKESLAQVHQLIESHF